MVAFHYPPVQGSSGVHRTLSFSRYLPENDWQPIVLTVTPRAYPSIEGSQTSLVPPGVIVERAFALDSARHLAVGGRHLKALALPDRWISWWAAGVFKGLHLIRRHRPAALWSTYPIATAHLIALTLHRLTGLRWIADFRDPMTETDPLTGLEHPLDPTLRRIHRAIERATIHRCDTAVFATPGAAGMHRERYPDMRKKVAMIANGYDEESFRLAEARPSASRPGDAPFFLLHSGLLYPEARDPRALFAALARLRDEGTIASSGFRAVFRASGNEAHFRRLIAELNLGDIVAFEPPIPYVDALQEMTRADALLILQASNCNSQIPAKLYEYLRARRPILALTDPRGDTWRLLAREGIQSLVPLDDEGKIVDALRSFIGSARSGTARLPDIAAVERHSRRVRTRELVELLDAPSRAATHGATEPSA
jgi:glycosyltransferase involved in cell wall biosynthesis